MSDLADKLRAMMGAGPSATGAAPAPKAPPTAPAPSLAALLAGGALPVQVRPEARPTAHGNVLEQARDALVEAGRFSASDAAPLSLPDPPRQASGLFGKIAKAGPKPRAKKEPTEKVRALSLALLKEMGQDEIPIGRNSKVGLAFRAQGVSESPELDRINRLPRRPADLDQYPDLTDVYRKPGGSMHLWPVQSAMLTEAKKANGLFAAVGAGFGKTLASLLVGKALDAKRIVLLIPPQLRAQLLGHNIPQLNQHWILPLERLSIVAYSELSSAKSADVLDELKPDLIVADEMHMLRHKSAARVKRFARYMKEHPDCRFVGLSGTITRKSLKDYGHLAELALRARSPLPHNYHTLNEWAEALDISKDPLPPGALRKLANEDELVIIDSEDDPFKVQDAARSAFRRRLVETPGVVATEEGAIGTSLVLNGLRPLVPAEVQIALNDLRNKWEVGSDELVDILSVVRAGTQIAAGFFTRWLWPDGIVDHEWLDARSEWMRELREILKLSRRGLDSPLLVANAIERGELESATHAAWMIAKKKYNPEPPRETVWISDYLIREAIRWGKETCDKANPGIIWCVWKEFAARVAAEGGFPLFAGGDKASEALACIDVKKTPVIVASVKAHGTGVNLQMFSRNLFTTPPAGTEAEQTIARTHRPGQMADAVEVDLFVHTDEMVTMYRNSLRDARYVETSSGQRQKLLYAERLNLPDEDS